MRVVNHIGRRDGMVKDLISGVTDGVQRAGMLYSISVFDLFEKRLACAEIGRILHLPCPYM
jgi:hypothetical protein